MLRGWSFEFYGSLPFWGALFASAVIVRLAGPRPRVRGVALLVVSSALLLAIPRFGPLDLGLVWALSGATLAASRLLTRKAPALPPRARRLVATVGVLTVLAFLAFFKYRLLQRLALGGREGAPATVLFLIGVSYFSFKAIHAMVESYKGTMGRVDGLAFLNYMTFFPAFISGPINRFPDFATQLSSTGASSLRGDLRAGGERIVHGLFKKFVLVPVVFPYVLTSQARPLAEATLLHTGLGLYATALYFYFDFSGYTDLAIGGARLVGFALPENFNRPFLQRNIRDLWTNWHMTLTSWLVDYVYWPVVRRLRNLEWFRTRPVLLSVVGMNVTFLGCGIWHGESLNFLVWGAYHGLGISAVNVYQRQKRRIPVPWLQRWFQSRYSRWLGAFATFNFFAAGLALFVLDLGKLQTLLSALVHQR